jgi:cobalt/nickel transport system permease protein
MRGAADGLVVPGNTPVHRLPAHVKVVALLVFVAAVVTVPPEQWWALVAAGVALLAVVRVARLPAPTVLRRMLVETPFVVFALVLPFVATGPRVDVLGVPLSQEGLVGAWNLLAKATLGVVGAIVLAGTTTPRDLVAGLERLRLPTSVVQIVAFMLRYAGVVVDDLHRLRVARESRGAPPGWLSQLRAVAATLGALFVRTYERGERVHQAMLARGWTGRSGLLATRPATTGEWATGSVLPATGLLLAVLASAVP